MSTTKHIITVAKAPDSKGTFEAWILSNPAEGDKDGERIESWVNIPGDFPLLYSHLSDPGSEIGTVTVMPKGDNRHLLVYGRLSLRDKTAQAIYERMLLPSSDAMALRQLSVGFEVNNSYVDDRGVKVFTDTRLLEISVVYRGAQTTAVVSVKNHTNTTTSTNAGTYKIRDHFDPVAHEQSIYKETLDALGGTKATDRQLREQVDALVRDQDVQRQVDALVTEARLEHVRQVLARTPRREVPRGGGGTITDLIELPEPVEDVPGETYRVPLFEASESPTPTREQS